MNEVQAIINSQAKGPEIQENAGQAPASASEILKEKGAQGAPAGEAQDADFSRKFAALSKRQKELFLKEQALKEQESKYKPYEELEVLKQKNPLEFIKKSGLSVDQIIEMAIKEGEPPSVDDKFSAMEKKYNDLVAKMEAKEKESRENEEKKTIDAFKKNLENELKSKADKFELVNALGVFETVYDVIAEKFQQTGEIISTDEAAEMVENYYFNEAKKLKNVKKLWGSVETKTDEPSSTVKTDALPSATLNSAIKASSSGSSSDEDLTFEQRVEKARALMKSQGFR